MTVTAPGAQILEHPLPSAQAIATAGPVVFAMQPAHVSKGYVEVERPNKQSGWISQSALAPGPDKCIPTLMSNGLVLIGSAS